MSIRYVLIPTLLVVAACGGADAAPPAGEFDAAQAMARVAEQQAFGNRIPGTPGHAAMAVWLDSLARLGADTVIVQRWNHVTLNGDTLPMVNVIARFNPDNPDRILYMAHWDTRPHADAADSRDSTLPVPGANDGASGVAVLLGVMDALKKQPPKIGVDLLFEDGEDYGKFVDDYHDVMIGARHFAAAIPPPAKPKFAVLWDMVGAKNLRIEQEGYSAIAAPALLDQIWTLAERMGYGHIFAQESGSAIIDDHKMLIDAGVPTVDVIGWPYLFWHTPDDTIDKLSQDSFQAVGNVAVALIREVDRDS